MVSYISLPAKKRDEGVVVLCHVTGTGGPRTGVGLVESTKVISFQRFAPHSLPPYSHPFTLLLSLLLVIRHNDIADVNILKLASSTSVWYGV